MLDICHCRDRVANSMPYDPPRTALVLLLLALPLGVRAQWLAWPPAPKTGTTLTPAAESVPYRGDVETVEMLLQRNGKSVEVWVVNPLAGPVQVEVDTGQGRPVRRTLAANTRNLLDKFDTGSAVNARMRAVPGPENGRALPFFYALPVPEQGLRIDQADAGRSSHGNVENRHALDFAAPLGTPVFAARDGWVMQVENNHPDTRPGQNAPQGARPNFVRVLHGDGSMALYAHLQQGSAVVQAGRQIGKGERLGSVGNSGQSTAPHLHFTVQVNTGLQLTSVPVEIETSRGLLRAARD